MKKLIIIFLLLIAGSSFAQIDTATWSIQRDGLGYYSVLTNRVTVGGVVAGGIRTPLIMSLNEIDTTNFQLIRDGLGYYSAAISKADMYGIDSGKIRVTVNYSIDASPGYVYMIGNESTDGSWRFYATLDGDCVLQKRIGGVWTEASKWEF